MSAEWSCLAPSPEDSVQFGRGTARLDGRANLFKAGLQLSEQRGVVVFYLAPARCSMTEIRGELDVRIVLVQLAKIREIQARRGEAGQSRRRRSMA
jgi:hypothetical protein